MVCLLKDPMDAVRVNQQLGQLALKGVRLEDRKADNGNDAL